MTTEINTLEEFELAVQRHDLTHAYSDDGSVWQRGSAELARIRQAAKKFPAAEVKRIWDKAVDKKLVERARKEFYWKD